MQKIKRTLTRMNSSELGVWCSGPASFSRPKMGGLGKMQSGVVVQPVFHGGFVASGRAIEATARDEVPSFDGPASEFFGIVN